MYIGLKNTPLSTLIIILAAKFSLILWIRPWLHDLTFSVNGTTGEGMSLSVPERKLVTKAWTKVCKELNIALMVQIGGAPYPDVIELVILLVLNLFISNYLKVLSYRRNTHMRPKSHQCCVFLSCTLNRKPRKIL